MSTAYRKKGEYYKAKEAYQKAVIINPQNNNTTINNNENDILFFMGGVGVSHLFDIFLDK
jgi:tetratricopeptide (TPR) repeat protein